MASLLQEQPLLYHPDLYPRKHCISCKTVFNFMLFLNTTIILIINSVLFMELNNIYNEVSNSSVITSLNDLENIINNACNMYPEICN